MAVSRQRAANLAQGCACALVALSLLALLPPSAGQGVPLELDCTSQVVGNLTWFCRAQGSVAANAKNVYNVAIPAGVSEDLAVVLTSHTGDADLCATLANLRRRGV
jgi:hypothetical protein